MRKKYLGLVCGLILFVLSCITGNRTVYAAEVTTAFGSENYMVEQGKEFDLGVYLRADAVMGEYRITLEYDAGVLEYISGADETDEGRIYLSGDAQSKEQKRLLRFRLLSDQSSYVSVTEGNVRQPEGEDSFELTPSSAPVLALESSQELKLESLSTAPATLEDFKPDQYVSRLSLGGKEELQSIEAKAGDGVTVAIPDLGTLKSGHNILTVSLENKENQKGRYFLLVDILESAVELPVFTYEGTEWRMLDSDNYAKAYMNLPYGMVTYSIDGVGVDFICNENRDVFLVYAQNAESDVALFAYNPSENEYYRCERITTEDGWYYKMPVGALVVMPSAYSPALLNSQGVFAAIGEDGQIGLYQESDSGTLTAFHTEESMELEETPQEIESVKRSPVLIAVTILLIAALAVILLFYMRLRSRPLLAAAAVAAGIIIVLVIALTLTSRDKTVKSTVQQESAKILESGAVSVEVLEEGSEQSSELQSDQPEENKPENQQEENKPENQPAANAGTAVNANSNTNTAPSGNKNTNAGNGNQANTNPTPAPAPTPTPAPTPDTGNGGGQQTGGNTQDNQNGNDQSSTENGQGGGQLPDDPESGKENSTENGGGSSETPTPNPPIPDGGGSSETPAPEPPVPDGGGNSET